MNALHLLVIVPMLAGIFSFFLKTERLRQYLLIFSGMIHLILSLYLAVSTPACVSTSWIGLDALGKIFLLTVTVLFAFLTVYIFFTSEGNPDLEDEKRIRYRFVREPGKVFYGCLNFFLASMSMAVISRHYGLQWIGIETTTLASTPLIYLKRSKHSLEAAWKYLVICSVGISLALLGIFFLAMAMPEDMHLFTNIAMVNLAGLLNQRWLQIAFVFIVIGYGTKMGLAPMHTWLPDAHGEAPPVVSALLSGALLNCAFLGILRVFQVCLAAGIAAFAQELLLILGLFSMGIAALFILHQVDYKRMLAYSSVEHMGILAVAIGLGGKASAAAMLHCICHSMTKAGLFFVSGNIYRFYHTKRCDEVQNLKRMLPFTGALWLAGFLAITGTPPFATFLSEFVILKSALETHSYVTATLYTVFLAFIFIGMLGIFLGMFSAPNSAGGDRRVVKTHREKLMTLLPSFVLFSMVFILTFYAPETLKNLLNEAASTLGGRPL
ncbi:MAG: proton-conducting transporter membrane subunit [Candidatus Rifleibacteriota bacterium]